ncbi:MAG: prephenate dehydratase domain-containing protein, partial [Planctomycetaceae bacterium]
MAKKTPSSKRVRKPVQPVQASKRSSDKSKQKPAAASKVVARRIPPAPQAPARPAAKPAAKGSPVATKGTAAVTKPAPAPVAKPKPAVKPSVPVAATPPVAPPAAAVTPPAETAAPKAPAARPVSALEQSIRQLDREIVKLINKRAEATIKFIESQPHPQTAVFDPRADDELWLELETVNPGPLTSQAVRGVFRNILSASRRKVRTQRVAYLGPSFSFTHLAAIERFGESADLIPVSTIASVFEEVNRGHANFGLVPIENSTDGRIVDTLDMFTRLPLRICGEVQISVHHNLVARCPRSEITEVYSKPQALSQCREWLSRNMPQARLIEVTSTSTAAQLARDKPGVGAVASRQAAVEYDLQLIAENIDDNKNNVTRFANIGEETTRPTGKDRTALLL